LSKPITFDVLICPECKTDTLVFITGEIKCSKCGRVFLEKEGKYYFKKYEEQDVTDLFDKIKYKFKKYEKIYSFLANIISPVCPTVYLGKFLEKFVKPLGNDSIVINLGSGNNNISNLVSNIDIFAFDNIDLTCDIASLPFKDNSVDVIMSIAVLEHVHNPQAVVDEIYRVLKPDGGIVYSYFPFIQGFHASPYDFFRVTKEGIKELFKKFNVIEIKPGCGPTSGLLWVFQEWFAITLSFGIKPLYYALFFLVMLITFPLKFLDILLIHHPKAENIASGFIFIGRK
jgi:SAM-dependent methyltransferase